MVKTLNTLLLQIIKQYLSTRKCCFTLKVLEIGSRLGKKEQPFC